MAPVWIRRVYACMRGRVNGPIFFLFLDKSGKLSKIVSVLQSASVERFDVSRMRAFFLLMWNKKDFGKKICIGPIIRIGREIRCLPYAGFFSIYFPTSNICL